MAAPTDKAAVGPLVAIAAGGPPLDELARLSEELPAGEWRARSDAAQALACYLACHPRVAEVRYPGLTADPSYQEASSTLRCGFGPWVDVLLADGTRALGCKEPGEGSATPGEKPGWLRVDVTDADAPAWVMRMEGLLAER